VDDEIDLRDDAPKYPPGVKPPRQQRSGRTFDALLEATRELLAERDFDDIGVADITSRANLSAGSFYARFDDKDSVLHAVVAQHLFRVRRQIHDLTDGRRWRRHQLPEVVESWVGWTVTQFRHPRPEFSSALARVGSDPFIRTELADLLVESISRCQTILAERSDEFGPQPARTVGLAVRAVVGALILEEISEERTAGPFRTQIELTAQLTGMALRVLSGERPSGATLGLPQPLERNPT